MCGIAGYVGTRQIGEAALENCGRLMRRRGPDASALRQWREPSGRSVYLLHTRLNIIDLDPRSNQPFQEGPSWMAYNGELYNYIELRAVLREQGETFRTTSDTEVFLKLIRRFGWPVLDRCEGMWAFAFYDTQERTLHLCRDRFGEKPLYLYRDSTGLYFGSEIKFIQALADHKIAVNKNHLYRYLVNGYKALYKGEDTFFEGIRALPPASVFTLGPSGEESSHRYWQPGFSPDDSLTYADAVSAVRERLIDSVRLRLRADVPLAFCMSGGVDSNALISIAKREFGYDVHGFTIVNVDKRYEEQAMVDCAVKELGIRHTAIPVQTEDFLSRLREQVVYHDGPVCTITYYAHWLLMKSIAEHGYRISVSGTAADELFSGYYDHHLAYLYELRGEPVLHAAARQAWMKHVQPIVRNPFLRNPDAFIERPDLREHIFLDAPEFAEYLKTPWSEGFAEERFTDSLLRNRMLNELFHEAVPVILHEDDLNAMYYSIENRSPYLDRGLFELCYRIPSRHLIREGRAKAVLRDAMQGIMPEPVRTNARKVGFNAPIFSFLDVTNDRVRREVLADSPIFEHVKRERIEALIGKPDLPNSQSKFLFYFLAAKLFLEEFDA